MFQYLFIYLFIIKIVHKVHIACVLRGLVMANIWTHFTWLLLDGVDGVLNLIP